MRLLSNSFTLPKLFLVITAPAILSSFPAPAQTSITQKSETIKTQQHTMRYEEYGHPTSPATIILLHGASGPAVPPYRSEAEFFADHGYYVLLPHYFDVTSSPTPSDANYQAWVNAVADLIASQRSLPGNGPRKIALIGLSLGSSVALAAGSQDLPINAIADWYGSLPDSFFYKFIAMPPLLILHGERDQNIPVSSARQLEKLCQLKQLTCESHLYSDQGHGFSGAALQDAQQRTLTFFAKYL
jgi:dienelactone hydrolase